MGLRVGAVVGGVQVKREGELKSAFAAEMKAQLPAFHILFHSTAGAPDRSITGAGRTTFWEMKHGRPSFDSPGNQELMCMRLEVAGYCRYVVWQEETNGRSKRTLIVRPRKLAARAGWSLSPEAWCNGYDHRWLVNFIKQVHGL